MFELELAYALEKNSMPVPDFMKYSDFKSRVVRAISEKQAKHIATTVKKLNMGATAAIPIGSEMGKLFNVTAHEALLKGLEGKGNLAHALQYARAFKGRAAAAGVGTLAAGGGVYAGGRSLNRRRKSRRALGM